MRKIVLGVVLSIGFAGQGVAAGPRSVPPADLAVLERAWHDCVRAAYLSEPGTQSRAASQRNALDACQAGEDAYVEAAMRLDADVTDRRGVTERARAWAASVAAEVIDPVSSWFGALNGRVSASGR